MSAGVSLITGLGALVVIAVSIPTLVGGVLGVCLLAAGFFRQSRLLVDGGGAAFVGGLMFAGLAGMAPSLVLIAAVLTVIAWDVGRTALGIAAEVSDPSATIRIELVHAVSSIVVFTAGATIGYAVFVRTLGQGSVWALAALLAGAFALLIALGS
ncbi:DUF7519 family protein [Halarchaeum nitratireducens]|uniref:DUF7519 family protein n=1 Tax=Halarchaeum nitratireducens TaxID=489913 RepID=UPI001666330E|nr:hypothetical protein [Halarchaeum nitratireducens]